MKTVLSPKIGIVSGIGPLAGSDVLAKVFKNAAKLYGAVEDNEYPDLLLLNHGIEGVDSIGTLNDTFKKDVVNMVQQLEAKGATVIGIACNTAHVYLDDIKIKPQTTLVNLIDIVAKEAAKQPEQYLLLTSSTSKQQKLYHSYLEKYGVIFEETTTQQQKWLDQAIGLIMAHDLEAAGKILEKVLAEAADAGFKAVIAGCTELPIALDTCLNKHGLSFIDSNYLLAQTLNKHYYKAKDRYKM